MATDLGTYVDLEERYNIPLENNGSIYRLFVEGSKTPFALTEEGLDLETWISLKTGYSPKPDLIYNLNDNTHDRFVKMTKKIDAFVMLYIPQNPKCQKISNYFSHLSDIFKDYKKVTFARVNCYETPTMCQFFNAPKVPAFRFLAWNTTAWRGKQIRYDDGEPLLDYLNRQLGRFFFLY